MANAAADIVSAFEDIFNEDHYDYTFVDIESSRIYDEDNKCHAYTWDFKENKLRQSKVANMHESYLSLHVFDDASQAPRITLNVRDNMDYVHLWPEENMDSDDEYYPPLLKKVRKYLATSAFSSNDFICDDDYGCTYTYTLNN